MRADPPIRVYDQCHDDGDNFGAALVTCGIGVVAHRRLLLRVAVGFYGANIGLGVGVATRVVDTSRVTWLHHVLYTATVAATVMASIGHFRARDRRGAALFIATGALAAVTRTSGSRRTHPVVALTAFPPFVVALLMRKG